MLTAGQCGDFLASMRKKPGRAIYIGCSYFPERQGKPLQAIYHVRGQYAADAETSLVSSLGLSRLKHVCCQWEAGPNT
ncbi:DUF4952 domain-containing protein [Tianweitania sp.]|uniref:DUF4952 domain-containing protein n=1 Tax=Tianweitania sp. TaxID=2021634 RepID=UPI003A101191